MQEETKEPSGLKCPQYSSTKVCRDGMRYLTNRKAVQRWLCKNCGYRFSNSNIPQHAQRIHTLNLNSPNLLTNYCQGSCEAKSRASTSMPVPVKTLAEVESRNEKRAAGATEQTIDVKGKLIEYAWWMRKQGYSDVTIRVNVSSLKTLVARGPL